MALITTLSWRQLDQIDKMAAKLEALQIQVTTLSSTAEGRSNASAQRLDTAERRNDRQDQQIEELQRRLWQIAPTRSP
jgi:MoaA/NifB/PqqE/SkfB family radical SAM enzyme